MVHAVEGDIATAIFMILDDTEKYGWNDRNSKREYFAHSEALIAQERSLIRVIELLRLPIPDGHSHPASCSRSGRGRGRAPGCPH